MDFDKIEEIFRSENRVIDYISGTLLQIHSKNNNTKITVSITFLPEDNEFTTHVKIIRNDITRMYSFTENVEYDDTKFVLLSSILKPENCKKEFVIEVLKDFIQ